jgi:hypothetical protein
MDFRPGLLRWETALIKDREAVVRRAVDTLSHQVDFTADADTLQFGFDSRHTALKSIDFVVEGLDVLTESLEFRLKLLYQSAKLGDFFLGRELGVGLVAQGFDVAFCRNVGRNDGILSRSRAIAIANS